MIRSGSFIASAWLRYSDVVSSTATAELEVELASDVALELFSAESVAQPLVIANAEISSSVATPFVLYTL